MRSARKLSAVIAVAGMSLAATGQTTRLVVETSADGLTWLSGTRFVSPNSTVLFRYRASFDADDTAANPIGLASLTFQPVIANPTLGQDVIGPFADIGNNGNGGSVVLDDSPLDGPFGRISPFAATGPAGLLRYAVKSHSSGSGGAPGGRWLRIARSDITRWVGTGPTSGTAAVNNFNGAGGIACVQKAAGNLSPTDPPFHAGINNVSMAQFALFVGPQVGPRTLVIDAPVDGMSRDATTGARQASWFAHGADNFGSVKAPVSVIPAQVAVVSDPWTLRTAIGPSPRSHHAMAYHAAQARTVLFGGWTNSNFFDGETWEWDGIAWSLVAAGGPAPRWGHAMSYDAARGVIVLFGGLSGTYNDETWEWNGSAWSLRLIGGPSPRHSHAMTYDSARGLTVLFGGSTNSGYSSETWEWDGSNWNQRADAAPSPRSSHALAFDPVRSRTVLFGGFTVTGNSGETWEFDGSTWTERAAVGPAPRSEHAMVFDPSRNVVRVHAGLTNEGRKSDSWEWNGDVWTQRDAEGPSPRSVLATVYDEARAETMLFGGFTNTGRSGETWGLRVPCDAAFHPPTVQPASATLCSGQSAVLNFGITATDPITYQWTRDGEDLPGETSPTLTLDAVTPADDGWYVCRASAACGSVYSSAARVMIPNRIPLVIVEQPNPVQACEGSSATMTVTVAGSAPISFQWKRNGDPIPGATSPTLIFNPLQSSDEGAYSCDLITTCDALTSETTHVTVLTPLAILEQPTPIVACEGASVALTVVAAGSGPVTYQWKRGNAIVPGETAATLRFASLSPADAGSYTCDVVAACGAATSAAAAVTVQTGPVWVLQPGPVTICEGLSAHLSAEATGTGPLSYQWQHNGIDLPGATEPVLTFSPVAATHAGDYTCTATGACGTISSSAATLTVQSPLAASQQPEAITDCEGRPAVLSFNVNGTGPISYQWKRDDADIPGATDSAFAIGALAASDAGSYACTATGPCNVLVSDAAEISIRPATQWTRQPGSLSVCEGEPADFAVAATGDGDVTYQWMRNNAPIEGATGTTYAILSASPDDAGVYTCTATAGCGAITSEPAALSVRSRPLVTLQPQSQSVPWGAPATFGVSASGPDPMEFQWRRNGIALTDGDGIVGSNSQTLALSGTVWSDQGSYDCTVSSECGSSTTIAATLSVSSCPPTWASMGDTGFGERWVHAQAFSGVNGGTLAFAGRDSAGNVLGDTWLSTGNAWMPVATTGPSPRTDHAMSPLGSGRVLLFGGKSSAAGSASALGDTWEWDGVAWSRMATGGPTPRFGHAMTFDAIRGRVVLFGGMDATGTSVGETWEWTGANWIQAAATGPSGRFAHAMAFDPIRAESLVVGGFDSGRLNDTWAWDGTAWRLAAAGGFAARFYTALAFDPQIGRVLLFGGRTDASAMNDSFVWDGSAWRPAEFTASPSARWTHAMSYDETSQAMVVSGGAGSGSIRLADWWTQSGLPIVISDPASNPLVPGAAASFSVVVSRTDVDFQWLKGGLALADGGRVSGARTATLTIAGVQGSDQGSYLCVISNACGEVVSGTAELSCAAVVTRQPQGVTTIGGQSITLEAHVSTGGATTYRWRKDGGNLFNGAVYSGVLTPVLVINANDPTQSGSYTLSITNACGVTTTQPAIVEIACPADFNNDGGIDGSDVSAFFEAWETGHESADLNFDGGIDGLDVETFFIRWESGC